MIQALHSSALGMLGEQEYLDTTANNIANIHTYGYKKERLNFKDALYVNMRDASNGESQENLKKGTGVIPNTIQKIYSHGPVVETGRPLDLSLNEDDTFFTVENYNGEQVYSRNGDLRISMEDGQNYLVNSEGYYILDDGFNRITIDFPATEAKVDMNGNLLNPDGEVAARLGIVTFQTTAGLESIGGNNYRETENSGAAEIAEGATLTAGFIEHSNVDMGEEMVNMIRAQRAYQLSSRVLRTADEMEGIANSLRR